MFDFRSNLGFSFLWSIQLFINFYNFQYGEPIEFLRSNLEHHPSFEHVPEFSRKVPSLTALNSCHIFFACFPRTCGLRSSSGTACKLILNKGLYKRFWIKSDSYIRRIAWHLLWDFHQDFSNTVKDWFQNRNRSEDVCVDPNKEVNDFGDLLANVSKP